MIFHDLYFELLLLSILLISNLCLFISCFSFYSLNTFFNFKIDPFSGSLIGEPKCRNGSLIFHLSGIFMADLFFEKTTINPHT